ncbi:hypothetical protein [Streptomyces sp. NPDC058486]|uniref:hypothetical protein n=1 Tax=unclassified Streptomyces TaxID=2593676 RepID=UPI00364F0647
MKTGKAFTVTVLTAAALLGAAVPATAAALPTPASPAASGAAVLAVSPSIEPQVETSYKFDGQETDCSRGVLCLSVWDYTVGKWKVFHLIKCGSYNVSNWEGDGFWENHQTDGAQGRFYAGSNGTGTVLATTKKPWTSGTAKWSPVNSVRPC